MDTALVLTHLLAALGGIILGWTMRDRARHRAFAPVALLLR